MGTLRTSSGYEILVDDIDYEKCSKHSWCLTRGGYLHSRIRCKYTYLHRFIMEPQQGLVVDHINGDKLDNRRSNLRVCTTRDNVRNQRKGKGKNRYKGVAASGNKWMARIKIDYKYIYLGLFTSPEEARDVYNAATLKYFGEYAKVFPHNADK